MKTLIQSIAVTVGLLIAIGPAHAELVLIAHPGNTTEALTAKQAKRIYLGKDKSFPGGGRVTAADQEKGSPARVEFYARIVKKSPTKLNSYWSKKLFSGKGAPPPVIGDDEEIKTWVSKHPNGLGYVDAAVLDDSVKVLLVVP